MVFLGCNSDTNPKSSVLRRLPPSKRCSKIPPFILRVQKSSIAYFNIDVPENVYLSKIASLDKLSVDECVLTKCVLENDGLTRSHETLELSDSDHEEDQH